MDHTYTHPYRRRLADASNFLLTKGVDAENEILRTERLIIANGETPSEAATRVDIDMAV